MQREWTPGPWHVRFGGTSEDSGFTVASRDKAVVAEHWPAGMLPDERARINADARLIAAAPVLFEALQAIVADAQIPGSPKGWVWPTRELQAIVADAQIPGSPKGWAWPTREVYDRAVAALKLATEGHK